MSRRPDMLSRAEAAAYLGCTVVYLARKTPHKGGPATVKVGRTPYYLQADLDAWLAAQRRPSLAPPPLAPLPEVRKSLCPAPPPASDSPASPSTSAKAPRIGGSTSATAGAASGAPLAQSIAEKLRRRHGSTGRTSSTPLVALRGGRATTSPSSPAST